MSVSRLEDVFEKEIKLYQKDIIEAYRELRKYKLLEAELGIDLITLFKALKNGVCIQEEGYFECPDIYFHSLEMEFVIGWANKENMGYELLKDYGKTWALTRNELEEQKDD